MSDNDRIIELMKKEGFFASIRRAIDKHVEGDPWKERYIPVLSIGVALVTVIATPLANYFVAERKNDAVYLEAKQKEVEYIQEAYRDFCTEWKVFKPKALDGMYRESDLRRLTESLYNIEFYASWLDGVLIDSEIDKYWKHLGTINLYYDEMSNLGKSDINLKDEIYPVKDLCLGVREGLNKYQRELNNAIN
ncbi:hypothetical protein DV711_15080 [Motiliproteus coralliicola]|uniref:DUF4760 domain-containing protein n=1 Tax=Motiliproteus coralliicola TaxID=2283196 RepID=A0A369WAU4_9GAMM|nr:hypothetical protein [Motiliproteus coralliicola]RDE18932.1 hypothetical protein DV711_15080 [Motiliproteus coralliicola]